MAKRGAFMIIGKKVILRAIEESDIKQLSKWINDREITQFLTVCIPLSEKEEKNWYEDMLKKKEQEKSIALGIADKKTKKLIGDISLEKVNWINRNSELGIFIGEKAYWGKGYGTEAVKLMLKLAFEDLNLHKVYLDVYDFNKRAIKSYEKCGFKQEGMLREHIYKEGKYRDVLTMGITKKTWEKCR